MASAKKNKNIRSAQRPSFAKVSESLAVPDLLTLQTESFDWLIGNKPWKEINPGAKNGLEEIFAEISPIVDSVNPAQAPKMGISFDKPELYDPEYTPEQCKEKGRSYTQPLYILSLIHISEPTRPY